MLSLDWFSLSPPYFWLSDHPLLSAEYAHQLPGAAFELAASCLKWATVSQTAWAARLWEAGYGLASGWRGGWDGATDTQTKFRTSLCTRPFSPCKSARAGTSNEAGTNADLNPHGLLCCSAIWLKHCINPALFH